MVIDDNSAKFRRELWPKLKNAARQFVLMIDTPLPYSTTIIINAASHHQDLTSPNTFYTNYNKLHKLHILHKPHKVFGSSLTEPPVPSNLVNQSRPAIVSS